MPPTCPTYSDEQRDCRSVETFREYLQIQSVQPDINYDECVKFLRQQAEANYIPIKIYYLHPNKPIVILTWEGTDPTKPSILLNSHMDVVPVFEEEWTYPPFAAHMDEQGNIYARGSQDMKCVGIQYLEAIRRMWMIGERLSRTLHISFVPDEEIGGILGMKDFVHTAEFKAMNVGFALDEGVACPEDHFYLFNGERSIWHLEISCPSTDKDYGSSLLENSAGEKLQTIINHFMEFRESEKAKLKDPTKYKLGDVTSVNLTRINGQSDWQFMIVFDLRLAPTVDHEAFEATIKRWCEEAGPDVTYYFEEKNPKVENTKLDDSNPFWLAFKDACDKMDLKLETGIFPGGTDSRYVREVGIPALGFSPMNKTKILLHDHNEHLNKDIFLKGIEIYYNLIMAIGNL